METTGISRRARGATNGRKEGKESPPPLSHSFPPCFDLTRRDHQSLLNIAMQSLTKKLFIDIPQIDMNFTRAIFRHTQFFGYKTKNYNLNIIHEFN